LKERRCQFLHNDRRRDCDTFSVLLDWRSNFLQPSSFDETAAPSATGAAGGAVVDNRRCGGAVTPGFATNFGNRRQKCCLTFGRQLRTSLGFID